MDPVITAGTREWPTPLDLAALRDVGWGDTPQSREVPVPYTNSGGTVTFDIGELKAGDSVTAKIVVRPTQAGAAAHSVLVAGAGIDPDPSNNTAQVTTQVNPCPPLVVNSTWDGDDGVSDGRVTTLREAIRLANLLPGKDTISFNIPHQFPTIWIGSALPTITDPVVIDGTTQPGFAGTPVVTLWGPPAHLGINGLHITAGDSVVRGLGISGFLGFAPETSMTAGNGILLEGGGGNIIEGNQFGTLGLNETAGITLINSSGNRIGGTTPEARNVISRNFNFGVFLLRSNDNVIQGNYIGTDAEGQNAVPNGIGIALFASHNNHIGGAAPGAGNVISGNSGNGIELAWQYAWFSGSNSNRIEGNYIGVAADGTTACGNGLNGVQVYAGADNIVGGRDPWAANTIAFNGGAGVAYTDSVTRNRILGNSIDSSGGLAIDRWPAGVTETPPYYYFYPSPDFPSLTDALSDADTTRIRGTLKSLPNTTFELDFYTSAAADPSGHGEGQAWLGTAVVTTDALGLAPFYLSFSKSTPAGQFIAATSTGQISTSEFSNSVVVQADRDRDGVADAEEDGGPNAGDADRDGTLDSSQPRVATFRNTGDQQYLTLEAPAGSALYGVWAIENPSPGNSPYAIPFPRLGDAPTLAVSLGDLDGDGDLDAFVANVNGQPDAMWLNDGHGQFTDSGQRLDSRDGCDTRCPCGEPLGLGRDVALGDLDGDGDLDAFVTNFDRSGEVWWNDGQGQFNDSGQRIGSAGMRKVALGDVDGDGSLDAFLVGTGTDSAWLNDGHGFFTRRGEFNVECAGGTAVDLADFDGDGDQDAIVSRTERYPYYNGVWLSWDYGNLWLNDGQGRFQAAVSPVISASLYNSATITGGQAVADVDNDGDLDAVVTNDKLSWGSWLRQLKNLASEELGYFGFGYESRLTPNDVSTAALGDMDSDGDVDLVFGDDQWEYGQGTGVRVWFNNGAGDFEPGPQRLDLGYPVLGDLNGDGALDILVMTAILPGPSGAAGMAVKVWLNDGHGEFQDTGAAFCPVGNSESPMRLGDIDGDGDLDVLIVQSDAGGYNELWLNDGSGHFTDSSQQLGGGSVDQTSDLALGDMDGDGDLDVYLANPGLTTAGRSDNVWLNDGHGHFSDSGWRPPAGSSTGVRLADLDGDGDPDAFLTRAYFAGGYFYFREEVWFNDGHGYFSDSGQRLERRVHETYWYGHEVAELGDLDGDGDLDALIQRWFWLNDGQGRFSESPRQLELTEEDVDDFRIKHLALGDADSDGDLDMVLVHSPRPVLWLNQNPDEINHPPVVADDGYTVAQGSVLNVAVAGVLANDQDPDGGHALAILGVGPSRAKSFEFHEDGSFSYTPWPVFSGLDSFTYEAYDSTGLATTATVTLLVVPAPAAPVAEDDFATTGQGVAVAINVTANDSDRNGFVDPVTVVFVSEPTLGQASVRSRHRRGDVRAGSAFTGTDRFSYQITGPTGLTDAAVVTVEILPPNVRPTAEGDAATTNEDTPVTIDVTGNDRDADGDLDPSTVRIVLAPANGSACVDPVHGTIQYSPGAMFFGQDMFTYEVCDTHGASARARVTLTVLARPNAPVASDDATETGINQPVTIPVLANDFDADDDLEQNTPRVLSGPAHGQVTIDMSSGTITYQPFADFTGSDQFTYEVCDATALCDTAMVTVEVTNSPPVAVDDAADTPEAVPVNIDLTGNDFDPDGNLDPRSVRVLISPFGATVTLDPQTGIATYTPRSGFSGVDLFAYEISDTTGTLGPPAVGMVHIVVTPVNDPPQAQDDTMFAVPDTPIDLDVLGNDTDVDSLIDRATVRIEEGPSSGSAVAQADGSVRYTPRTGFTGTDEFRYTVQDDAGARSNVAVVSITVQAAAAAAGRGARVRRRGSRRSGIAGARHRGPMDLFVGRAGTVVGDGAARRRTIRRRRKRKRAGITSLTFRPAHMWWPSSVWPAGGRATRRIRGFA